MERGREGKPPGPGVEPRREIQHAFHFLVLHHPEDDLVHHRGPHDHRPGHLPALGHGAHDRFAPFPGQPAGIGVPEDRVGTLGLHGPIEGHPARGVGDVLDQRGGHGTGLPRGSFSRRLAAWYANVARTMAFCFRSSTRTRSAKSMLVWWSRVS